MKVLAILFAMTIAGKIGHSDSEVSQLPRKLQLLSRLVELRILHVGKMMVDSFILPTVPPQPDDLKGDESKRLRGQCLKSIPQREDGCGVSAEHHKCYKQSEELLRKRFPENAKWMPELMTKTSTTLQDFVCDSEDGEALVSEWAKIKQCEETLKTSSDKSEVEKISSSIQQSYEKNLEAFKATPTKANLCKFAEAMVDMKSVEKFCNNNKPFEAVNRYFAASFKALCA